MRGYIKKIGRKFFPLFLALTLLGVASYKNKSKAEIIKVNGIEYLIQDHKLKQITEDSNKEVKLGVISDIHGYCDNAEYFSNIFKKEGVDYIIINGDIAQHFGKKKNPSLSDYDEIYECIKTAAKTSLPVLVLPGNHETRKDYYKAMKSLKKEFNNIFDLSEIRALDLDDVDIVSNPYGNDNGFSYFNFSFTASNEEIYNGIIKYAKMLKADSDPELLVSHQPLKTSISCIDKIFNGMNVGNPSITKAIQDAEIPFGVFGHIHEARGGASNNECVKEGKDYPQLYVNSGSASPWQDLKGHSFYGSAAIIEINNGKAKYKIIKR